MKPLDSQTNAVGNQTDYAAAVIETVLLAMKTIRGEMSRHRPAGISVPQFRVLGFIKHHPGASLSMVAEHIGLTLPSMSTAVDGLVKRGLVEREPSSEDRRRVSLTMTDEGREAFESATAAARSHMAEILTLLDPGERDKVAKAMQSLRAVLLSSQSDGVE